MNQSAIDSRSGVFFPVAVAGGFYGRKPATFESNYPQQLAGTEVEQQFGNQEFLMLWFSITLFG